MLDKLKRKREIKNVKAQLQSGAQQFAAINQRVTAQTKVVGVAAKIAKGQRFTWNGVGLVETRTKRAANYGSMPVNIGDVRFRVGRVQDASRDELTHIDTGSFVLEDGRCVFTGSTQTRVWEHSKIVGYDTSRAEMLLIAVSNRERMSGISYGKQDDFAVEAYFVAWYERERNNARAVADWGRPILADLEDELARAKAWVETGERSKQLLNRLIELVGKDDAQAFCDTLPGVRVSIN